MILPASHQQRLSGNKSTIIFKYFLLVLQGFTRYFIYLPQLLVKLFPAHIPAFNPQR